MFSVKPRYFIVPSSFFMKLTPKSVQVCSNIATGLKYVSERTLHVQLGTWRNVFESNIMAVFASWLPSDTDRNCASTEDGNLALVSESKDVRRKGSIGLEASMICGDMDVRSRREDPIMAGATMLTGLLARNDGLDTAAPALSKSAS